MDNAQRVSPNKKRPEVGLNLGSHYFGVLIMKLADNLVNFELSIIVQQNNETMIKEVQQMCKNFNSLPGSREQVFFQNLHTIKVLISLCHLKRT